MRLLSSENASPPEIFGLAKFHQSSADLRKDMSVGLSMNRTASFSFALVARSAAPPTAAAPEQPRPPSASGDEHRQHTAAQPSSEFSPPYRGKATMSSTPRGRTFQRLAFEPWREFDGRPWPCLPLCRRQSVIAALCSCKCACQALDPSMS